MRRHWIGLLGIALVIVGLAGIVVGGLVLAGSQLRSRTPSANAPSGGSLGQRIFTTGTGVSGRSIPRSGPGMMMGGVGCSACHGSDGRGRRVRMMMGSFEAPDIRYSTLTSAHEDEQGWSDDEIRRAIVQGVEPNGQTLSGWMPRWRMTSTETNAVLGYLKELSSR